MLFIIYLSYIILIWPLLEARAEIQKYFVGFLVQMKSLEFAFEINWPLADIQNSWSEKEIHILFMYSLNWRKSPLKKAVYKTAQDRGYFMDLKKLIRRPWSGYLKAQIVWVLQMAP